MSFTVQSRGFLTGSPATNMWNNMDSTPMAADEETSGAAISRSPVLKDRVCMVFFERGECPYNDYCEHAHHFSELDAVTQSKLLSSVPMEVIPLHFMGLNLPRRSSPTEPKSFLSGTAYRAPFECADFAFEGRDAHSPSGYSLTRIATHTPPRLSTPNPAASALFTTAAAGAQAYQRGLRAAAAPGPLPPAASLLDASFSSRTTASGRSSSSSQGTPTLSGACVQAKSQPSQNLTDSFQIQLPARCHYPHPNITGTYYDVLGVDHNAVQADIIDKFCAWQQEGYKQMRLVDPSGAEARDRLIVEARNVLGHSVLRAQYDHTLATKNPDSVRANINATRSPHPGAIPKSKNTSSKGKWKTVKL